jgi:hypothetical protein
VHKSIERFALWECGARWVGEEYSYPSVLC